MDTMLSKALREFLTGQLNQLIVNLAGENGAKVEEELKKFNRGEPCYVMIDGKATKPAEKIWPSLTRRVSDSPILALDPTEGQMSSEDLQKVFPAGIYGDFENFPSQSTGPVEMVVHEQTKNGKWNSIFKGISTDLKTLVWQPRQIVEFCVKHHKWLRTEGYGTFFLLEKDGEFFVASVYVYGSGLGVGVVPLSIGRVWFASNRHRVVVRQPETLKS